MLKRGADMQLLLTEVVGITLSWEVIISPRYTREPLSLSLQLSGNFLRFHQQVEHNASLFKICIVFFSETRCKDRNYISNLQILTAKFMTNAQNIDKIFAELAKKVQREVQINLPRKVGIIA